MGLRLDASQQAAAFSPSNTVVTAGAGSGKTTVLARRFVYLIENGLAEADGILTLTFTRKAAAEMYERIYRLLLQRTESASEPEHRERCRRAVEGFDEAQISTLDSFCARIVRGGSSRFGVSGDFRQDEFAAGKMISETALQFLLEHANHRALRSFVESYGMEQVLDHFLIPLAEEEFHLAREYDFSGMFDRQRDFLMEQSRLIALRMEEERRWFLSSGLPTDKKSLQSIREGMEKCGSPVELQTAGDWPGLHETAARKMADRMGGAKDPVLQEARERLKVWKTAAGELEPIIALFLNEDTYRGVYSLLGEYQRRVMSAKRSSGALTFRDVVEMAVLLLREDTDLRNYYKRHFSHIMIDEFQDNNNLQRQLLFLLAEKEDRNVPGDPAPEDLQPGKLFFVGDEKQSIYKFRGADVRVLKSLQNQLQEAGGSNLHLAFNYRSHSGLIEFFNALFSRILASGEDSNDFEARFTPLVAPRQHTGFKPTVRLFYKPYDPEGGPEGNGSFLSSSEAEAWTIVRYIKDMVESKKVRVRDDRGDKGGDDRGADGTRPVTFDDVAVLMRSSSNQIHLEKYLRRSRVPYTVQSIRSLFQEAPINDIYQYLQLIVYPGDRIAYAALLRSPFVHLSDDTVMKILIDQESGDVVGEERDGDEEYADDEAPVAFRHSGEEDFFQTGEEKKKYIRAKEMYEGLTAMARHAPVAQLIRTLWYDAGYRYVVLRNPDYHHYLEFYDALISLARLSEQRGENLAVFLDFVRDNLGDYKKLEELDIIPRRSGGVQLLSIHKSKGLEFPVVIIADMGNTGAGEKERLFVWDDEYGLVLNLPDIGTSSRKNYFTETARERMRQQETAELKRLLYVACTRAQDHLILSGYHHSHNKNLKALEEQNVLLNMVLQAFGWDGETSPLDLPDSLGCRISKIEEYSSESVQQQSSYSRGIDLEKMSRTMEGMHVVRRSFLRREWSPTGLNEIYRSAVLSPASEPTQRPASQPAPRPASESSSGPGAPGPGPEENYSRLDALLLEHELSAAFGELVHSCIEYGALGKPDRVPLPPKL
ncbi:MAG: UvrD-helicase domain-containing protein, partial [Spirochaetota bacterium]|nr:UvrD-helicase domain-containing protein [Spirochaetota bacterium]